MRRRSLVQSLLLAPLALSCGRLDREMSRITVQDLEVFRVSVNRRGNWIVVRLHTSAGVSGLGDASHGGPDEATVGLLHQFSEILRGRSIFDVEWLRGAVESELAQQPRAGAVALSALEQCLWDIRGKVFGVPVHALLGGRLRGSVRNYANINRSTPERSPEGFANMARRAVQAGFDAIKLAPFDDMPPEESGPESLEEYTRLGIERAQAVRDAIGPDRDLLIDAHSRFDLKRGLALAKRLEPLELYWLEEVARPLGDLAAINRAARMPTAGGESLYGVKGFYPYLAAGAVDILMPDIKYCGGVLELKKIAAMAEGAGLPVAPHGPASPVGNLAAAHVSVTIPNFSILEFSFGEVPWRAELIDPPEQLVEGYLRVSDRPGLGITLNEKVAKEHEVA